MGLTPEELAPAIAGVVASAYDLSGPVACRFLQPGFNLHYRLETAAGERHVRLYLDRKYYIEGDDDLAFELALTDALADSGCPVARPVRRTDGRLLTVADLDGDTRRLALFEIAPGNVNTSPPPAAAEAFGAAVAGIHEVADRTSLPGRRYHLDERYLLDQPVRELRALAGESEEIDALDDLATRLKSTLARVDREPPTYGIIHADLHLGNIHFSAARDFTIFDFDHCAHGFRAYDLAPIRMSLGDDAWGAFLTGYGSVRDLPAGIDALDDFVLMRVLWDVGDVLAMQAAWGNNSAGERIRSQLPKLLSRLGINKPEPQETTPGD